MNSRNRNRRGSSGSVRPSTSPRHRPSASDRLYWPLVAALTAAIVVAAIGWYLRFQSSSDDVSMAAETVEVSGSAVIGGTDPDDARSIGRDAVDSTATEDPATEDPATEDPANSDGEFRDELSESMGEAMEEETEPAATPEPPTPEPEPPTPEPEPPTPEPAEVEETTEPEPEPEDDDTPKSREEFSERSGATLVPAPQTEPTAETRAVDPEPTTEEPASEPTSEPTAESRPESTAEPTAVARGEAEATATPVPRGEAEATATPAPRGEATTAPTRGSGLPDTDPAVIFDSLVIEDGEAQSFLDGVAPTRADFRLLGAGPGAPMVAGSPLLVDWDMFNLSDGSLVDTTYDQRQETEMIAGTRAFPSVFNQALVDQTSKSAVAIVYPVGMADLPEQFDPSHAYLLVVFAELQSEAAAGEPT